jgi:ATP-dependent DNA helicase RecG
MTQFYFITLAHGAYDKYELIVAFCDVKRTKQEIMDYMRFSSKRQFNERYMKPLLQSGRLRMTLPDKPSSKNQRYVKQ